MQSIDLSTELAAVCEQLSLHSLVVETLPGTYVRAAVYPNADHFGLIRSPTTQAVWSYLEHPKGNQGLRPLSLGSFTPRSMDTCYNEVLIHLLTRQ
jgi:hypothetical protein